MRLEQELVDGWMFAGAGGCHGWEMLGLCMVLCSHCEHGRACCRTRKENCARALHWTAEGEGCTMPQVSWCRVRAAKAALQRGRVGPSECTRPSGIRLGTAPHTSQGSVVLLGVTHVLFCASVMMQCDGAV